MVSSFVFLCKLFANVTKKSYINVQKKDIIQYCQYGLRQYNRKSGRQAIIIIACLPLIFLLFLVSTYTTPENPINAIANNPAVIKAIGVPFIPSGIFTRLICSRKPAKSTRANPKPIAVENA